MGFDCEWKPENYYFGKRKTTENDRSLLNSTNSVLIGTNDDISTDKTIDKIDDKIEEKLDIVSNKNKIQDFSKLTVDD